MSLALVIFLCLSSTVTCRIFRSDCLEKHGRKFFQEDFLGDI